MENIQDQVICPYCPDGVEMKKINCFGTLMDSNSVFGHRHTMTFCYACPSCGTESPRAMDEETALHFALRRYQPENRVLTSDEINAMEDGLPVWYDAAGLAISRYSDTKMMKEWMTYPQHRYGHAWRCWLRKPTETELKAVPWG